MEMRSLQLASRAHNFIICILIICIQQVMQTFVSFIMTIRSIRPRSTVMNSTAALYLKAKRYKGIAKRYMQGVMQRI